MNKKTFKNSYILYRQDKKITIAREFLSPFTCQDHVAKCNYVFGGRLVPPSGVLTFETKERAVAYRKANTKGFTHIVEYDLGSNEVLLDTMEEIGSDL